MFCPACGTANQPAAQFCFKCGKPMPVGPVDSANPVHVNSGLEVVLPINVDPWAIFAGYLGLFSVLAIPAPFAIFTGIMALRSLKKNPGTRGHVRAWVGILGGSLAIISGVVGLLVAASR